MDNSNKNTRHQTRKRPHRHDSAGDNASRKRSHSRSNSRNNAGDNASRKRSRSRSRSHSRNNAGDNASRKRSRSRSHNERNNGSVEIDLLKEQKVSRTNFGGYPLDLFFGMLFLKMKHKKTFGLPFKIRDLIKLYSDDIKNNRSFTFIGCMVYKCKDSIINKDLYSSSEEVVSSEESSNNNSSNISSVNKSYEIKVKLEATNSGGRPKYTFHKNDFEIELPGRVDIQQFISLLNELRKTKGFTAIPLIIRWSCASNFAGHANILLIDLAKKTIERFEPYGKIHTFGDSENVVLKTFDIAFSKMLNKTEYKYYKTNRFSPKKGPQYIEEEKVFDVNSDISSEKPGDPEGFCGAWSLWYADLRISNPTIPRRKLLIKAIKMLKYKNNESLRSFIRNYATFIVKHRTKFIKKLKVKKRIDTRLVSYVKDLSNKKTAIEQLLKTD
jgi:hypothetical protein